MSLLEKPKAQKGLKTSPMGKKQKKKAVQLSPNERDECLAETIVKLGDMSYRMEEARYSSLLSSSAHILTCLSIISIALISLLGILTKVFKDMLLGIGIGYAIVFAILIANFIVALVAQLRFKYNELQSPYNLGEYTHGMKKKLKSKVRAARYYCSCLEESHASLKERNRKISSLIQAATIMLIIVAGTIALEALILALVVFSHFG